MFAGCVTSVAVGTDLSCPNICLKNFDVPSMKEGLSGCNCVHAIFSFRRPRDSKNTRNSF